MLKKILPAKVLDFYHRALSSLAAFYYGHPSEKLIVIGVTGTNGKSTVVHLIAKILETAGFKTGATSTISFKIGEKEQLNHLKMTMPGRFWLQKFLDQMKRAGCQYAVIESSSEGILQYRHLNIHYDVMVFTNLTPEHLERHGGFENYKKAKLAYFQHLQQLPHKIIAGKIVPKTIVVNLDSPFAKEFLDFSVDQKITFSAKNDSAKISGFLSLAGKVNIENALAAMAVAQSQGIEWSICQKALSTIKFIPGRFELIEEGQNFRVMVDYAPEPYSLRALYETVADWPKNSVIHVLGSTGGGRDKTRRKILGEMAGKFAETIIVTNEDPYDEDPQEIINEVAAGAKTSGKQLGKNLFKILDRREAISKAIELAQKGDLVLITGKGSEQAIVVSGGKKIPWDDRQVAREELRKINQ